MNDNNQTSIQHEEQLNKSHLYSQPVISSTIKYLSKDFEIISSSHQYNSAQMSPFILFNNFQVLVVIVILSSISVSFTAPSYDFERGVEWTSWKGEHKKIYNSYDEEKKRYSIWLDNRKYIEEHNNKNASKLGFTLKMNQFGDLVRA